MSYNSNHYTPRYNNNTSRKLHEQAKRDTQGGGPASTGASSSANTPSTATAAPSRVRDKPFISSSTPGYSRREHYAGGGYAGSTASSRSRYNRSYSSSKVSTGTGPSLLRSSSSIPSASSSSSGYHGSSKDFRGNASGPGSYYGPSTSQSIRRSGAPPSHRYGSTSKYSSDAASGEKFISRAGPVSSTSGSVSSKSGTNASSNSNSNSNSMLSGYRDERRSRVGAEDFSASAQVSINKETEPNSAKISSSSSEQFISTTSKNLKGNISRKSSVESVKRKPVSNTGNEATAIGASSILDISRRDSARDEHQKGIVGRGSIRPPLAGDSMVNSKELDENRNSSASKDTHEATPSGKVSNSKSVSVKRDPENQHVSTTDGTKVKTDQQSDTELWTASESKTQDQTTETILNSQDRQEVSSDSSKDLRKEKSDPKGTEFQSSPPSSSPPLSMSSSTSSGSRKTSLSDYLKKSKIKKTATESETKSGIEQNKTFSDQVEVESIEKGSIDDESKSTETGEAVARSGDDENVGVSETPVEDVKFPALDESAQTEVKQKESSNDDERTTEGDFLENEVSRKVDVDATDKNEQVDEEMRDASEEIEVSLVKKPSNNVVDDGKTNEAPSKEEQTSEQSSSDVKEETTQFHISQSGNDNENSATEKAEILSTPKTKLNRSDSFADDTSMLSPVNESELDVNFNFNEIGTMPEIPEETETPTKDTRDKESKIVLSREASPSAENGKNCGDEQRKQVGEPQDSEGESSEAETIIGTPPPRLNQGVKLLKKKPYDSDRHLLKRKKMIISSSDEENNVEDEDADTPKSDTHNAGENFNMVKQETTPGPKRTFSETKDKKLMTGKAMKKPPYKIKRDSSGRSLLQRACKKGNIDDVRDYLNRGASANEKDFCGFTCLHEAALEGHNEIVQILIDHGANVNAKADEAGDCETPLIDAAENMHLETVEILLKNNADPNIFNLDGFTALTKIYNEHADEEGYDDIIKVLEDASNKFTARKAIVNTSQSGPGGEDAEFEIIDDPNESYFAGLIKRKGIYKWAAENRKEVVASHFVAGNSLEDKPDILIIAARNGHSELIDIILGLNPTAYNIDTESKCGVTALLASVGRGHFEVVQSLLSKGADPFKTRKKDGLTALQIVQHSAHFDAREIEIIQEAMEKKSGTKILSAVPSRVVSRTTSRAPSVPVSDDDEEEGEQEEEEDEVMEDAKEAEKKNSYAARPVEGDDSMDIDEPEERTKVEASSHRGSHGTGTGKLFKTTIHEKSNSKKDISDNLDRQVKVLDKDNTVADSKETKKRKHEPDTARSDPLLKKTKSESSIKVHQKESHRPLATGVGKSAPSDSAVPKLHNNYNNAYEKSISPNTVVPSHDNVSEMKSKARSPSPAPPSPVPSISAAAIEEQKVKTAEEARIWQEKVEAKKKARREMFLKSEKEKELKKKEEEEKKLEEERELAALKREQELKLVEELERKSKAAEAKKVALTRQKLLDYYPIGLRKLKLNSKPTDASITKYLPFYVFIINDVEYVLDLQISLLTLTRIAEFESELSSDNEGPSSIVVESRDKVKLWKLFYKFIGIDHRLKTSVDIVKNRKQGEQLFDNLLMKFVPYHDIRPVLERKFPLVFQKLNEQKPVVVLLDSLQGFDDLTYSVVNEKSMENDGANDEIDVSVKQLSRFIPPHLSYRKDIIKTVKAACNPLWVSRSTLYHDDSGSDIGSDDGGYVPPNLEFEFIEVDDSNSNPQDDSKIKKSNEDEGEEEEEDEFAFPLFASASKPSEDDLKSVDGSDDRGRPVAPVQKVSLREHSEERINNERPDSYYFALYTPEQKLQFTQVAVSGDDIYAQYFIQPNSRKLIDLNEYNAKIDAELARARNTKKKNRPGKKKRESRIVCRERRLERAASAKKEEKERKLKEKQEKYGKFKNKGGRNLKKTFNKGGSGRGKTNGSGGVSKPKYRTE
ncbi:hypothetical protein KGF57_003704 [Candida theae]|uniref:Uncharacterized protein n=1 Tax=Candida theae TaxID=1198502 RepID=A0AAD5BCR8_9ASCO|nr:uncharacterized protein KGF57_003704 [Candida theae]KAI5955571.1 hypothetical protein KGF57_003704 [Candida theae]